MPNFSAFCAEIGLPPVTYAVEALGDSVEATICRYLNSRIPVIALTADHATVLIGYGRRRGENVFFVQHDDSIGPYETMTSSAAWKALVIPMPGRLYLTGEEAEAAARRQFSQGLAGSPIEFPDERWRLRTYASRASDYKQALERRRVPVAIASHHRAVATSNWIWVVELQERDAANRGRNCVRGEVVVDATSDPDDPNFLFAHFADRSVRWGRSGAVRTDGGTGISAVLSGTALHIS